MSLPPASPGAPSAAAAALAHLFDSPTPPRPTAGRGRPGNSALFLNSPTSSAGGGSPFAPSRQQASGRFELPLRGPAAAAAAAMDDGAAAAGSSTGNRTDALALFDGVDFDDAALDAEINGTAGGAGDDGLDGVVSSALNKRSVPKIDEARLLGNQGISTLVKRAKTMKFQGKGHEAEDLSNLLDHYHVWAHTLFPKSKFRDTIRQVERVCKTRTMTNSITRFKLEYDPPAPASPTPPPEPRTGDSPLPDVMFASSRARASRSASPSGRRPLFARGGSDEADEADRRPTLGRAEAVARALAATAAAGNDGDDADDFDMDDLIRQADEDARIAEAEMALGPNASRARGAPAQRSSIVVAADDEEEMDIDWAELDAIDAQIAAGGGRSAPSLTMQRPAEAPERSAPQAMPTGGAAVEEVEQEDWDAFDEMNG